MTQSEIVEMVQGMSDDKDRMVVCLTKTLMLLQEAQKQSTDYSKLVGEMIKQNEKLVHMSDELAKEVSYHKELHEINKVLNKNMIG